MGPFFVLKGATMEQELNAATVKTLHATTGGSVRHQDLLAPVIVDLTYRTTDPMVVDLTITVFMEFDTGAHAESSTWQIGRDLLADGFRSHHPVGNGDFAIHYCPYRDQATMVLTDSSERNTHGERYTHRLVVDALPMRTLLQHACRLVPSPELDVDGLLANIFQGES